MDINDIITTYIKAKEEETAAKKRKEAMKALILEHAGTRDFFDTCFYAVTVTRQSSTVLDTQALYKDFPDIKAEYGKPSEKVIVTTALKEAMQKTA